MVAAERACSVDEVKCVMTWAIGRSGAALPPVPQEGRVTSATVPLG